MAYKQCLRSTKVKLTSLSVALYIFILCTLSVRGESVGVIEGVNNVNTQLNIQDLANLMEMFPEFREYVYKLLKEHVEHQQKSSSTSGGNVRLEEKEETSVKKTGWGWTKPKEEQGQSYYGYGYKAKGHVGYGWSPASHQNEYRYKGKGYGWPPTNYEMNPYQNRYKSKWYGWPHPQNGPYHDHDHHHHNHHESYKDPKFHYHVGYELGKDLSCILGFFGLKSIKDITIFSVFSFLKKLKGLFIFSFAFKLGLLLSPFAVPLLFPLIVTAVVAKVIPMILIICLLFKLLKAQLKLGIRGREHWGWRGDDINEGYGWSGMEVNRLLNTIENVTQSVVVDSENCVDKIVCKIIRNARSFNSDTSSVRKSLSPSYPFVWSWLSWISEFFPGLDFGLKEKDNFKRDSGVGIETIECDRIPCTLLDNGDGG